MEIINCEQGTPEWFEHRLGLITASNFSKVTTTQGKKSASQKDVINTAIAELILGRAEETFKSEAMMRGNELEDEALDFFNFTHGFNFAKVGFLKCDGYGASPDSIDLERKIGLEIKCPLAKTHVSYLRSQKLPTVYFQQVQGSLMVSGFDSWYFGSYHPEMPPLFLKIDRDEEFIEKLRSDVLPLPHSPWTPMVRGVAVDAIK